MLKPLCLQALMLYSRRYFKIRGIRVKKTTLHLYLRVKWERERSRLTLGGKND